MAMETVNFALQNHAARILANSSCYATPVVEAYQALVGNRLFEYGDPARHALGMCYGWQELAETPSKDVKPILQPETVNGGLRFSGKDTAPLVDALPGATDVDSIRVNNVRVPSDGEVVDPYGAFDPSEVLSGTTEAFEFLSSHDQKNSFGGLETQDLPFQNHQYDSKPCWNSQTQAGPADPPLSLEDYADNMILSHHQQMEEIEFLLSLATGTPGDQGNREEMIPKERPLKRARRQGNDAEEDRESSMLSRCKITIRLLKRKLTTYETQLTDMDDWYIDFRASFEKLHSNLDTQLDYPLSRWYSKYARQHVSRALRQYRDTLARSIRILKGALRQEARVPGFKARVRERQVLNRQKTQQKDRSWASQALNVNSPWKGANGLPNTAVGCLKSWLFNNFLHPYPGNDAKETLSRSTGLSKMQVSNWFINMRVRLWKPMIEALYLREYPEVTESHDDLPDIDSFEELDDDAFSFAD